MVIVAAEMVDVNGLKTSAIELRFNKIFRLEPDMIGTSDGNMPCFRVTYFDDDCGYEKVIYVKADFKVMRKPVTKGLEL